MGNSSLRRQASQALKKAGAPKLWVKPQFGKKYGDILRTRSNNLRDIIHLAGLKPGDIVFDCDGFNHRIKSFKWKRLWHGQIWADRMEFEDGTWSCGCMVPEKAHTPKQINAEWLEMLEDPEFCFDMNEDLSKNYQLRKEALLAGKSLCDLQGFVLPEFRFDLT